MDTKEFDRAQKAGKSGGSFWKDWEDRMQMKTVVLRTLALVKVDPARVNEAYVAAERDLDDRLEVEEEVKTLGNTGPIIEIGAGQEQHTGTDAPAGEETKEEPEKQAAGARGPSF